MECKNFDKDLKAIFESPTRQKAIDNRYNKRKDGKHRKMMVNAIVYAAASAVLGLMGCAGCFAPWISFPSCLCCCVYATFLLGRWFEFGKFVGWK